jgi:hypothetical protein
MAQVNLQGHIKLTNPTPLGFHLYASQFLTAAQVVDQDPFSPVRNYLLSRAIELGIKAFLLSRGDSVLTLKSKTLGHDLAHLLARARNRDFDAIVGPTAEEIAAVDTVNRYYKDKVFEYFQQPKDLQSYPDLLSPEILPAFIARLLERIHIECVKVLQKR